MESQDYTAAEIALAMGVVKTTILRRAEKEKWKYTPGKNGARQFIISSFPTKVQQAMIRKKYNQTELTPQELAEHFKIKIPPEKLEDPKYQSKIRMVVRCLAVPKGARHKDGGQARGRRAQIKEIAESYGYNIGTAYRLLKRVKNGKPLIKTSKNYGAYFPDLDITLRAWDEQAGRMAIEMIMANKRRHVDGLTLYQTIKDTAESEQLKVGTYASFMQLKKRIKPALKTYRDKGIQGLKQDIIPAMRRDPTAYRPMECLVGDQHKADYYAIDSSGNVATLELFCWMDFRTQLVWGSIAYKHYNRYTVGQALINAVRWGLPSTCYTDWGKPEESKYITLLIKQLTGLGIKTESIKHTKATQRHPQAKPIEGWFGNFDRRLKNAQIPGYCKRLKDSREGYLQQKEIKRLIKTGGLLDMPDLTGQILGEIEAWNRHLFKNRNKDNGKSPLEIYTEEIKHFPVTTLSDDTLDYIFLPKWDQVIKRCQVSFQHEWLGKKVYYDRALADFQGCMAEMRYDPFDPWRVWVFVDGKLICEAEEWEMINPKVTDQVAEKMAEQKALAAQIKETYKKYLPPKQPIRRINPHEREARQMRKAQSAKGIEQEIRVLETSLEKAQGAKHMAQGGGGVLDDFRRQFRPRALKVVSDEEYKPLFQLNMKQIKKED